MLRDKWEPARPGWGLIDAKTKKAIDPVGLVTDEKIPMTPWEIHSMGVQVALSHLQNDGVLVRDWQDHPAVNPTLWIETDSGQIEWAVIATVVYPEFRAERPEEWDELLSQLSAMASTGRFGSVALASASQTFESDDEPAVPLWRGYGMFSDFSGLQ
jgi:hypothetical protein